MGKLLWGILGNITDKMDDNISWCGKSMGKAVQKMMYVYGGFSASLLVYRRVARKMPYKLIRWFLGFWGWNVWWNILSYIYIYTRAIWAFPKSEGNCPQKKLLWIDDRLDDFRGHETGGNRHLDHPPGLGFLRLLPTRHGDTKSSQNLTKLYLYNIVLMISSTRTSLLVARYGFSQVMGIHGRHHGFT